jgi:hypothetical protein
MTIKEDTRAILYQHPPSRIVYPKVYIPASATLELGVGVDPKVWSVDLGDGIEFQVWVQEGESDRVQVYGQYLDPKQDPECRRWFDARVDLDRFAGQTVEMHFVTLPGPVGDERYDWAGWSAPVLVTANPDRRDDDGRD